MPQAMVHILYVEDTKDTAEAVQIILQKEGYQVDLAYTGEEGLKKIKRNKFDLILLDIMLPDMSGWDIFEKIKEDKSRKIALLSAVPISTERFNELKKAGICDYISKPFSKEQLIAHIQNILKTP